MKSQSIGPDRVLTLSMGQAVGRMAFWLKVNVWHVLASVAVVTLPPASAALYHVVREGLRDPFETHVNARKEFVRGLRLHFARSYSLAFLNMTALAAIVFATAFWFGREPPMQYVAVISIAFFMFWWLCQPFLLPMLVERPDWPVREVIRSTFRLVIASPLIAFTVALAHSAIALVSVLLMGPSLLVTPTFAALISIQSMWAMTHVPIPDLTIDNTER